MIGQTDPELSGVSEDTVLVREVLAGSRDSFSRLAMKYRKRIFSLGFGFFHNADDAEDFVQDVLVKVYVSLSSFRGESLFSTWLMRIAYNTAVNSVKRKREYTSLAEDFDVIDPSENPEEEQLRRCACEGLRSALKELPERYRACVDMFFFYDMPYADISEVTGQPVNTIKSNVFRAKKMLKDRLDEGVEP